MTIDDGFPPNKDFDIKFLCHSMSEGDMQKYMYLLHETDIVDLYEMISFNKAKSYLEYQRYKILNKRKDYGRN